jgi:hypothetical protein
MTLRLHNKLNALASDRPPKEDRRPVTQARLWRQIVMTPAAVLALLPAQEKRVKCSVPTGVSTSLVNMHRVDAKQ